MFTALTPIIGILVAVGVFFTYVRPTLDDVKVIQGETDQYAQAVDRASELQARINELRQQQSAIPIADLERLEAFLPDKVDEVSLLIDIDALADAHGLELGDITVEDAVSEENTDQSTQPALAPAGPPAAPAAPAGAAGPAASPRPIDDATLDPLGGVPGIGSPSSSTLRSQYSTLSISFTVDGTYDDFRSFLQDIEKSLVLMEIAKLDFGETEGDTMLFKVTLRFYSLNAPTD